MIGTGQHDKMIRAPAAILQGPTAAIGIFFENRIAFGEMSRGVTIMSGQFFRGKMQHDESLF